MKLLISFMLILGLAQQAYAVTWYYLEWNPPSGSEFTQLSAEMVVPEIPEKATYYIWPGLQPTDNSGVYQNVLDGRTGAWWIGSGWCCSNPDLAWGSGFDVYKGDTVQIKNVLDAGTANWTSTLTRNDVSSSKVSNDFPLADKSFNQAIFAIELYDVSWNFGSMVYNNVVIIANTSSTSWCTSTPTNYQSATKYTITGLKATSSGSTSTCTIQKLEMVGPA